MIQWSKESLKLIFRKCSWYFLMCNGAEMGILVIKILMRSVFTRLEACVYGGENGLKCQNVLACIVTYALNI